MFDFLGEILLGVVFGIFEALGEIVFDGVMEAIAKVSVAIWNALQTMWQEFWR